MKDHDIINNELLNLRNLLLTDDRNNFQEQLLQNKNNILNTINEKVSELKQLNKLLDEKIIDLISTTEKKYVQHTSTSLQKNNISLTTCFDKKIETLNITLAETIQNINDNNEKLIASQNTKLNNLETTFFAQQKSLDEAHLQKVDSLQLYMQKSFDSITQQLTIQNKKIENLSKVFNEKLNTTKDVFNNKIEQNLQQLDNSQKLQSQALLSLKANLTQDLTLSHKKITDSFNNSILVEKNQTSDNFNNMRKLISEYNHMTKTQSENLQKVMATNLESLTIDLKHKFEESSLQQMQLTKKVSDLKFFEEQTSQFITNLLTKKVIEDPKSMAAIISPILNQALKNSSHSDRLNISKELSPLIATELNTINENLPKNQEHLTQLISDNLPRAIEIQNLKNTPNLPNSLAPLIGKGLQAQINDEKDKIVDALYPVIGSTISKYMAESMKELVHKINTKIEEAFSFKKYFTRLKNKALGNSNSGLEDKSTIHADPQSIYLIHKKTGVVILDSHKDGSENSQKHMVGGMFSAITSFVNDWIEKEGENKAVDSIEYGDSKVIFEASGSLIIAVVVNFGDTQALRLNLRSQLADLHLAEHQFIENFNGDTQSVPERIKDLFKPLFIY